MMLKLLWKEEETEQMFAQYKVDGNALPLPWEKSVVLCSLCLFAGGIAECVLTPPSSDPTCKFLSLHCIIVVCCLPVSEVVVLPRSLVSKDGPCSSTR